MEDILNSLLDNLDIIVSALAGFTAGKAKWAWLGKVGSVIAVLKVGVKPLVKLGTVITSIFSIFKKDKAK